MDPGDPAYKGQRDYGPALLAIYDWWVLGVMANLVLRSPTELIVERYRPLYGRRHLDVGPGSGYFVDVAAPDDIELTLLDPNRHVLDHCAKRLSRFDPTLVEADVLKPLPVRGPFDSVALSAVLHCLPGPMEAKEPAIEHVASVLDTRGVLFGVTVLGADAAHSVPARAFLRIANLQGGFDNLGDTVEGVESMLTRWFSEVEIDIVGSLAHFTARSPIRRAPDRSQDEVPLVGHRPM
jgi:SAM-dependent methyltransferase